MSAGVFSARGIGELNQQIIALDNEGYKIITVFETHEEFYHVVAQKEDWVSIKNESRNPS